MRCFCPLPPSRAGMLRRLLTRLSGLRSLAARRAVAVPLLLLSLPATTAHPAGAAADPVFSPSGPDAVGFGAEQGYPARRGAVTPQTDLVGNHSRFDTLWPFHLVPKGATASPLARAPAELALTYRIDGAAIGIDGFLDRNPVTGLLIARDETILYEHYQYGRTDRDRLLSQSMAKTVTSMLLGIALSEGRIRSIDDTAATYVPELAGSAYGETSLRALLHMASGVAFRETYDGADDIATLGRGLFVTATPAAQVLAGFTQREAPPDTRFHYASSETEVLGLVVTRATGMPLATYLSERIWQPMGAEADATWILDRSGQEVAYCCLSATLRDWARFGLLLAHDGAWNGRQIIPREWVLAATGPQPDFLAPGTASGFYGYGFQVWRLPGPGRAFALLGIHGQAILVDPARRLVMVQTAVRPRPSGDPKGRETVALWRALVVAQPP